MHTVECPRCQCRFRLPAPARDQRMKCSRCGNVFVGSTAPVSDLSEIPQVPPRHLRAAAPRPAAPKTVSSKGVLLVVACFLGVAGIVVLAVWTHYRLQHPHVEVRDAKTGQVTRSENMPAEQADRLLADVRAAEAARRRPANPNQSGAIPGQSGPTTTAQAAEVPPGDPNLSVSAAAVSAGAVGEETHVCGRVLSAHTGALKSVTVTAYVNGARGPSRTYLYVPPRGTIQYSILLGAQDLRDANIQAIATCVQAEESLVVWEIPSGDVTRSRSENALAWSGVTRNTSGVPVKNVKVYCDFFAADGIQAGSAVGEFLEGDKLGMNKTAGFRVVCDQPWAEAAELLVARAVGQKY